MWLTDARAAIKTALIGDNLFTEDQVIDFNPERVSAPCAILTYGSPMLSDGEVFGDFILTMNATLVPQVGTNETETDDLDSLVERSIAALISADYGIGQVGQPYMLQANNAQYLAVDVQVVGVVRP